MQTKEKKLCRKFSKVNEDKWNIKLYKRNLKHQLILLELKRLYDFRSYATTEVKLDHYLVDTRKKERSGDDQGRCDLEEELYKNGGRYDG